MELDNHAELETNPDSKASWAHVGPWSRQDPRWANEVCCSSGPKLTAFVQDLELFNYFP